MGSRRISNPSLRLYARGFREWLARIRSSTRERHGPGGPAGLQNRCGRVTHGSVGSTPAPLRSAEALTVAGPFAAAAFPAARGPNLRHVCRLSLGLFYL